MPGCYLVFNTCLSNGKIPKEWGKKSNTNLPPKHGIRSPPRNWRPISLHPTIYKMFAAVLARHVAMWVLEEGKISPTQKRCLLMEGCVEHSFTLQSLLEDHMRRRKNVRFLWLDLICFWFSTPGPHMEDAAVCWSP